MGSRALILPSILLASFLVALDTTIVNVALPSLVRELDASTSELQWIVDAYSLVFAAFLLAAGSLSDRVGRKGVLLAGLAVFGAASFAGGLMDSPDQLIVARAVMGLGAALIFPPTLSLISNIFVERHERAKAIGLWGAAVGGAVALGPLVGGWLLEAFDWSSIFFAMAPVAALAALLIALNVPTSRDPAAPKADPPGLVLSTAAVALLIYTIIEAPDDGWGASTTIAGFAVAAALLVAFLLWERRTSDPLLDVGLFRNLRFTAASGSVAVVYFTLAGFLFLITQYFQFLKGYGPFSTGVRMLPVALSLVPMSVVGTKLAVRYGTKVVVTAGLVCLSIFFVWVSTDTEETGYFVIACQMVLSGIGMGLRSAPATEAIMGVVPKAKAGVGSAVNDATRIPGSTLGVAVIGSVFASLYASRLTDALPAGVPDAQADAADDSMGAGLELAERAGATLGPEIQTAAVDAFLDGMSSGLLVAGGVSAVGALMAAALLPAQPVVTHDGADAPVQPAVAAAE